MNDWLDELIELEDANREDQRVSDRCDIDPIAALREDDKLDCLFSDTVEAVKGSSRRRGRARKGMTYSAAKGAEPEWVRDRSKLPKKPPRSKS